MSDSAESTLQGRPYTDRDLLREALDEQEPVTKVEERSDGAVVHVAAIQEYDGTAYRCTLTHDERSGNEPRVSFYQAHWNSSAEIIQGWSPLATGCLSGPQHLGRWESLFTVFNAAIGTLYEEVSPEDV